MCVCVCVYVRAFVYVFMRMYVCMLAILWLLRRCIYTCFYVYARASVCICSRVCMRSAYGYDVAGVSVAGVPVAGDTFAGVSVAGATLAGVVISSSSAAGSLTHTGVYVSTASNRLDRRRPWESLTALLTSVADVFICLSPTPPSRTMPTLRSRLLDALTAPVGLSTTPLPPNHMRPFPAA